MINAKILHKRNCFISFIFTAKYPALVKKLILVSSGVFDYTYAAGIMSTRLHRLSREDRSVLDSLVTKLNAPENRDKNNELKMIVATPFVPEHTIHLAVLQRRAKMLGF